MTAAGILLVWRVQVSLTDGLDAVVTQQAQAIATSVQNDQLAQPLPDSGDGTALVQVVDEKGAILAQSGDLKDRTRLFTLSGGEEPIVASRTVAADGDDDDGTYRVAALAVQSSGGTATVYAALPTASVTQSVDALTAALAVGVPMLVVALAVLSWFLIGRALRPVETLRRQAAAIPATDLHRRLSVPAARDDLGRLAATLNDLLARIEASTERQRSFVADAAHELRSPIASLQAQLEVAARHPDAVAPQERLAGLLADTRRLGRLTDDLLALARMDSSTHPRLEVVDLDDVVLQETRRAGARDVQVITAEVSAARVLGDPSGLSRLVRNLLDNALRHATSDVRVTLVSVDGSAVLTVADDGSGIGVEDRERVFERFTRLDDARARDDGGAGLGLAIVAEVVRAHQGTIRVDDARPGAMFTVTIPAAE